jgi:polysaccharide export outer membrane protein
MRRPRITIRRLLILVAVVAMTTKLMVLQVRQTQALQPPDMVDMTVRSALPGRPISGTRLVRPDGTISLGNYGMVSVAGLTPREARAVVAVHLRRYLSDQIPGLVESVADPDGRNPVRHRISPSDTDRVSIRLVRKNSRRPGVIDWVVAKMGLPDLMGVL